MVDNEIGKDFQQRRKSITMSALKIQKPTDKDSTGKRDTHEFILLSQEILRDYLFGENNINAVAFNYHDLEEGEKSIDDYFNQFSSHRKLITNFLQFDSN